MFLQYSQYIEGTFSKILHIMPTIQSVKDKYMKYKAKYMSLKNINMIGGGYFKDIAGASKSLPHRSYSIMADISNPALIRAFSQRRNCILKQEGASGGHTFHLTLLTIEINRSLKLYADRLEDSNDVKQPDGTIKKNKTIKQSIVELAQQIYNATFLAKQEIGVILTQERMRYHKMGDFFSKKYPVLYDESLDKTGQHTIASFWHTFYYHLRKILKVDFQFEPTEDGKYYLAFDPKNKADIIFAVPNYYWNEYEWAPHVSVVRDQDILIHNPALHGKISGAVSQEYQEGEITKCLLSQRFDKLPDINMMTDIDNVRIG